MGHAGSRVAGTVESLAAGRVCFPAVAGAAWAGRQLGHLRPLLGLVAMATAVCLDVTMSRVPNTRAAAHQVKPETLLQGAHMHGKGCQGLGTQTTCVCVCLWVPAASRLYHQILDKFSDLTLACRGRGLGGASLGLGLS